jgi:hypothetical protein
MIHRLLSTALAAALLAGCSGQKEEAAQSEALRADQAAAGQPASAPAAPAPPSAPKGVQWPDLRAMDDLTHRTDALAARSDSDALRELLPELHRLTLAVASAPAPAGTKDTDKLAVLQKDLASLAEFVSDPATMTDAEVIIQSKSFHPLVLEIMAAAGMPHVH